MASFPGLRCRKAPRRRGRIGSDAATTHQSNSESPDAGKSPTVNRSVKRMPIFSARGNLDGTFQEVKEVYEESLETSVFPDSLEALRSFCGKLDLNPC